MQTLIDQITALPQRTTSEGQNYAVCHRIIAMLQKHGHADIAIEVKDAADPSGCYYDNTGRDRALELLSGQTSILEDAAWLAAQAE